MKFPRNARIFRGQLDAAPLALVFFLMVIFLLLGGLVYTPGVKLQLPTADNLAGADKPTVAVAIDAHGRYYYQNHLIEPASLKAELAEAANKAPEPLTLLVQADRLVSYEMLLRLTLLARDAGISEAFLATLPRDVAAPERALSQGGNP